MTVLLKHLPSPPPQTSYSIFSHPNLGKTLLAKAVANQTSATFLRVVGSELIQKYLGDGPKLVRELFRVAEEHAPSIVFIDEIDAIGTKRYRIPALASRTSVTRDSKWFTRNISFATILVLSFLALLPSHNTLFDVSIFNK